MNEDLNSDLDRLIADLQADFLVNNPKMIGKETQSKEYFVYMAETLRMACDYLAMVHNAYFKIAEEWEYKTMPLQERINKITGVTK